MTIPTTLAQTQERIPFWDNAILDEWRIPFGDWMKEIINWLILNLGTLFDVIKWPFSFLFRNFVDGPEYHPWWEITDMSWVLVCGGVLVVGMITRNLRVGLGLAVLLALCGLLGNEFWEETTTTIGLIGVAVALCVVIGIPVGILCGRIDGVWKVVRPVLDAMQVVHAFVYIIPFIFFFGLGPEPATIVTMVFAVPPLIRLTNLGIRQVPSDVVEASRAYGASEARVLFDVQIPLARPAIMTGINQTLLLAISMLGIAALMGSFGLGRVLLRAINNQDVGEGAAGGLAFFLVAVVLDRMSQRQGTESTNFFKRVQLAWKHRRDPEVLIPDAEPTAIVEYQETEEYAPVANRERLPMLLALIGGLVAVVSAFLPWTSNAGKISAFGRWADASLEAELAGQVFSGLSASGGSWFGITVLALGLFVVIAVAAFGARPGRAPRWLAADGTVMAAISILVVSSAHLLAQSVTDARIAFGAPDPGHGIGVYLAIAGGLIGSVGAILWIRVAEHSPLHPLPLGINWGRIIGLGIAILILLVGVLSGWSADSRPDRALTPEAMAEAEARAMEIEDLKRSADEDPENQAVYAADLLVLEAQARQASFTSGIASSGPRLGLWALIAGVLAMLAGLPAAGVFGGNEQWRWRWSTVTAGLGSAVTCIALAWILTHVRSGDTQFLTGYGAFITLVSGLLILASTMAVLKEFRRSKVYGDPLDSNAETGITAAAVTVGAPM